MMTKEELNALITQSANPDTAPMALSTLRDSVTSLIESADALKEGNARLEQQVAELRDTNMRLFLRTTENVEQEEAPEETLEDFNKRIAEQLMKGD